jgi:phage terminase large subunit-like protein
MSTRPIQLRPGNQPFQLALHPSQREVAESPSRFKVICCGRQWGKTHLGAALCVQVAGQGGHAWWVGPSFPVGELGMQVIWRLCRQIAEQVGGFHFEGRPVWRVTFPNGGTIQMRSADNPDSLRGATLDLVVFDEAATAKVEAWPTLRPTLSVRRGKAVFISTP